MFADDNKLRWVREFKYLGYWITSKLGFGNLINKSMLKIRQRIGMINSFRFAGVISLALRKTLLLSYILPLFTWLFPLFPLVSENNKKTLIVSIIVVQEEFSIVLNHQITFSLANYH